ncbi:MAG: Lrp/AsnC family transcriptional regulator [Pseudomonadales bacterium]|nr:Lrp/AsnC family transcriptional regulator [Pseudomonadales bacterium]
MDLITPNARISNRSVSERLGVTEGAIRHRLKKMTSARSIRITTLVNPIKVGRTATVFARLIVAPASIEKVVEQLKKIDEIEYMAQVSGSADISLVMMGPSLDAVFEIFNARVLALKGVLDSHLSVVTEVVKHSYRLANIVDD